MEVIPAFCLKKNLWIFTAFSIHFHGFEVTIENNPQITHYSQFFSLVLSVYTVAFVPQHSQDLVINGPN